MEKLDRILISKEWESMFPVAYVYKLPREVSNHNPLILASEQGPIKKNRAFRFELSWLKDLAALAIVEELWSEPTWDQVALDKVHFKMKKVRQFLKGWGYNLAGQKRKRKKEIEELLSEIEEEELSSLSDARFRERMALKAELLQILDDEELNWFRRWHETWLLREDNNTEFFHRIANGRKRKQIIFSLQNGENTITGTTNLLNMQLNIINSYLGLLRGISLNWTLICVLMKN
jgi:hypothetical protein